MVGAMPIRLHSGPDSFHAAYDTGPRVSIDSVPSLYRCSRVCSSVLLMIGRIGRVPDTVALEWYHVVEPIRFLPRSAGRCGISAA